MPRFSADARPASGDAPGGACKRQNNFGFFRAMTDSNQIKQQIADLSERTQALRRYL